MLLLVFSVSCFSCAITVVDPGLVDDYVQLADRAVKDKQYDQAKKYYVRIMQLDPDRIDVRYNVLLMEMRLENWQEALSMVDSLLIQDSMNTILMENKAYILAGLSRQDESYKLYVQVFDAGLRRFSVLTNLRSMAINAQKHGEAFRWAEELYRLGQKKTDDLLILIRSGLMSGQSDAVKTYEKEYIDQVSKNPEQMLQLADVYVAAMFFTRAIDLANELLEGESPSAAAYFLRARARLLAGEEAGMIYPDLDAFVTRDPEWMKKMEECIATAPVNVADALKAYMKTKKETLQPDGAKP